MFDIIFTHLFQIWTGGKGPGASRDDIDSEPDRSSWGIGANITTKLCNPAGEVLHSLFCATFAAG